MAEYLIQEETLAGIADAIREKTGITGKVSVADMGFQVLGLYGENNVENVTVEPDFSEGDYVVEPSAECKVLGQVTVAKPETLLPENIAEGVDIAGIVGTLTAGGSDIKIAVRKFSPSGAGAETFIHGLGVVPDIIYCWNSTHQTNKISYALGHSRAFFDKCKSDADSYSVPYLDFYVHGNNGNTSSNVSLKKTIPIKTMDERTTGPDIHNVTTESFSVGSDSFPLVSGFTMFCIAIGGLT